MAEEEGSYSEWKDPRNKVDEELEFFTELALHETERWIHVSIADIRS